jgi:primosomal replication protein N
VEANSVALSGELAEVEPLRYTPAGIPLLNFRLQHRSQQVEAGFKRQVECELNGVAMGDVALALSRLGPGQGVRISGFLNRKNRMSAQLILHATEARMAKEDTHGDGKTGRKG